MPDGTVTRLFSAFAEVALDAEADAPPRVLTATLSGRLARRRGPETAALVVGDRVRVRLEEGTAVVEAVEPRRSKLSRRHPHQRRREQLIAANVDRALVVAAVRDPALRPDLVDVQLVAASAEGLAAGLALTKCDLATAEEVAAAAERYVRAGVPVWSLRPDDPAALERLRREFLADHVTVLVGESGVGKSTLRNALAPAASPAATGAVSEKTGRGRHVTTAATLTPLPPRGFLVDTPGMREFAAWRLAPHEVARHFPEFAGVACRFSDCRHRQEPGCGVRELVERGGASAERLASLLAIADSLEHRPV